MSGNLACFVWMIFLAFVISGCSAGGMKNVSRTGFINDYSQMEKGGDDQAALSYTHPGADLSMYDKIMIEKVCVCLPDQEDYEDIEPVLLSEFADYYDQAITTEVMGRYKIVSKPGPGVLKIRAAITDVKPSSPIINTISSISPIGITLSVATKIVSDKNLGTGEAASEIEVLDSVTGERLAAYVDRRQGGKMIFRSKWADAKEAFEHWARRLNKRLEAMCARD